MTDAGREVLLRDDGSWEYLSDDRFGTLKDGSRARLKSDGSWEIAVLIVLPDRGLGVVGLEKKDTIGSMGPWCAARGLSLSLAW